MRFLAIVGAAILMAAGALNAQEHPKIPDRPAVLKALDGEWVMSGDVMGEPVTYRMVAGPTLQGAFTEIHMNDVQVPSQYEARVLVGYDVVLLGLSFGLATIFPPPRIRGALSPTRSGTGGCARKMGLSAAVIDRALCHAALSSAVRPL